MLEGVEKLPKSKILLKFFLGQFPLISHFKPMYVLCVKANGLPIDRPCICALTTSMYMEWD